ncbi:hypothetical protein MYCTH_2302789 [Thermothelomyces thermophilus ATCC 42464]|uniref:DNA endonuclease activator Ctp1 C-terminal domain-containing protein n=1 Tax=Thermothelomyces thermophilus (strain ATCC 42464 / BCRC 31852 / DSM 1799) TaxID=573729 RepID=G2Q8E9_THET4|nr:uncharacterized protein MYCTH_2302789 [Thermothelomyces thermophilus ATCC 42464]AEO57052.1 hypothetical protein MYCTH_2302789 [Thermothelomyces thermophilus ATCC 42464]
MAGDPSLSTEALFDEERKEWIELLEGSTSSSPKPPTMMRRALAEMSVNSKIGTSSTLLPLCSSGPTTDWEREYSKLRVHFAALEQRLLDVGRRAREFRESREGWIKYARSLEAKIKILEKKVQRNQSTDGRPVSSSSAKPQPAPAGEGGTLSDTNARWSDPLSGREPEARLKGGSRPSKPLMGSDAACMPATPVTEDGARLADEETQDGSDEAVQLPTIPAEMVQKPEITIKKEPSSDPPVVVSERPVRKRKHGGDNAGTPVRLRRIKSEHSSSSDPVITAEVPVFCPHESIDLDEEEQGIPTPRKLRDWERRLLREEREEQKDEDASFGRHLGETRSAKEREPAQGPDALPAAPCVSPNKSPKTRKDRVPHIRPGWTRYSGIADVAEETFESFYSPEPPRPGMRPPRQTAAQGRLHSLLHEGSPNKAGAILPPARLRRAKVKVRCSQEDTENIAPGEEGEQDHEGFMKQSRTAESSTESPLRRKPQGKDSLPRPSRLRDRPLAELRPEDFKVNPRSNNGYKYAFDEVVRNREERAELAGCTDPNCCGKKFRAMAESELSAAGPGILSRVSDIKLMENYLGHDAYRLVEMPLEERQEIWLKAKTQDLADRYGRHRHRFARRPSPPGYWNPDFPSTQEIRASKEEAQRLEREVVEERWREAMRGGKWLFRDE